MRILAVVPARGGSKGIPLKNIAPLAGRPLIAYTLAAAQAAQSIERVVVSTDNAEIAKVCRDLGSEVLIRPAELANDHATTRAVLLHVLETLAAGDYHPDAVMTLQPTSPLRTASHIDESAATFAADSQADSLVSCVPVPHLHHPYSVMRRTGDGYLEPFVDAPQPTRRQDKEPAFARNGAAIYITRTSKLSEYIYGGRLIPYIMDDEVSLDIDAPEDLVEAERRLRTGQV
jgi:CMP-N,N'-diacetyllegionaminic acid synthase